MSGCEDEFKKANPDSGVFCPESAHAKDIDQRSSVAELFGASLPAKEVYNIMVPALAAYHECILTSLLSDEELGKDDRKAKVGSVLQKLHGYEKTYGEGSIQGIMYHLILSESTGVALATQ